MTLTPDGPVDGLKQRNDLGPLLQGALMERVDAGYAALLHQLPFNPYSQYCFWEEGSLVWRISALTDDAASYIIEPARQLDSLEVRSARLRFEVAKTSLDTLNIESLLKDVGQAGPDKLRLQFLTPTAFKSQGRYVNIPSVRLILQNLLMHYGQVYDNNKEGYEETIEYVDQHVRVLSYSLRSSSFGHIAGGGRRIPAFVGSMTLGLRGNEMTAGLSRMLLRFGEYAGVGIKTSMGMGGIRLLTA